ncbi:MAG: hypothetical protein LBJ15_21770 [Comamonas sp.]|jgi:hypothetical protein|uniref:hypothetical protein n=1 Tax=Comamonas sp. TaxID=34028 RepID=UPI0028218999|nr:hypothetical protein [Comamonas sp.]MDR0216610.1 hypothetical protein [Comamonas sp.]
MKYFKPLAIVSLFFFSSGIHAEYNWSLNLHTFSDHFTKREHGKQWNETNPGLGLRRDFSNDISLQAGFYKNSLDRWSTYAIAEYSPVYLGPLRAGLFAGLRTNYQRPVELAGGALVRWHVTERFEITARITPKTCSTCAGFTSAEFGWKF